MCGGAVLAARLWQAPEAGQLLEGKVYLQGGGVGGWGCEGRGEAFPLFVYQGGLLVRCSEAP